MSEAEWLQELEDCAQLINEALALDDHGQAAQARARLNAGFEAFKRRGVARHQVEMHLKTTRNELQRLYMVHGWHQEAIAEARRALQPLRFDRTCPNRPAVLRQSLARALMEAGDLERSRDELQRAIGESRAFWQLLRQGWQERPDLDQDPHQGGPLPGTQVMGGTQQ